MLGHLVSGKGLEMDKPNIGSTKTSLSLLYEIYEAFSSTLASTKVMQDRVGTPITHSDTKGETMG